MNNRRKLTLAFWIVLASFVTLTTAAYAWMSIASTVKVTDLALNVVTDNALELAPDADGVAGEYTTVMQMTALADPDAVLKPVTYSAQRDAFLEPDYGWDGRADFSDPLVITETQDGTPILSSGTSEERMGCLLAYDFWIRTGASNCTVRLSEPREVSDGVAGNGSFVVGKPVWNASSVKHTDGGSGAQNAIRIAFRTYDEEDGSEGKFVIFEPNADSSGDYKPTPSIDGTETLVEGDDLILQSVSGWSEQTPVLRDNVTYTVGDFISDNTSLFTLKAGHARRVTLYIWLEGQDTDCVNAISAAEVMANIQLYAEAGAEDNAIISR
ncbi:MAG: hypothetical protein EOM14_00065 [Clostridia bacterium]|nr:hypothetical protein [Clostridia bacterium]